MEAEGLVPPEDVSGLPVFLEEQMGYDDLRPVLARAMNDGDIPVLHVLCPHFPDTVTVTPTTSRDTIKRIFPICDRQIRFYESNKDRLVNMDKKVGFRITVLYDGKLDGDFEYQSTAEIVDIFDGFPSHDWPKTLPYVMI